MKHVMVRYTVKPERTEENAAQIQQVFEKLKQTAPAGLSYASYRMEDHVSFVHVASIADDANNPLRALTEFQTFTESVRDRCTVMPVSSTLQQMGEYRA